MGRLAERCHGYRFSAEEKTVIHFFCQCPSLAVVLNNLNNEINGSRRGLVGSVLAY